MALGEASGRAIICTVSGEGQEAKSVPLTWLLGKVKTLLGWCVFAPGFLGSSSNLEGSESFAVGTSDSLTVWVLGSFLTWRHGQWNQSL